MTPPPDLPALRKVAEAATKGPWTSDEGRGVWCDNAKIGGQTKIFDIRGWGYFTGQGHGALGLSEEAGIAQQVANGNYISAFNPAVALKLLAELEAAREVVRCARAFHTKMSAQGPEGEGGWTDADLSKAIAAYQELVK